ncbi:MAG: DEAD/DEAH box helicase [Candidatus Puniceispirillaceae bacterium]
MTTDVVNFEALGISETLMARLAEQGIDKPTPIQQQAIPVLLSGQDLMGLAQTGTGKTAAYLLPLIQKLSEGEKGKGPRRPKVLVLAPTRELAHQISISLRDFSRGITLRYVTICGGERYNNQISALKKGVDFIVATPGRFEDLQERGVVDLSEIEHVILDEADQMIDLGFYQPIKRICASTPQPCQTIFFSATMPAEMKALSDEFLHDHVTIKIESKNITADTVSQRAIMVSDALKRETLSTLLEDVEGDQVLIFVGTKRRADALGQFLSAQDIQTDVLHGDMRQNIRSKVLRKFKSGQLQVLVATDVAARGIDVVGLNWVINYDLPQMPEIYVHRIGRTGRAQQTGRAISLCAPTQRGLLMAISRHVNGVIDIVNSQGEAIEIESFQAPNRQRRKGGRPFGGARSGPQKGGRRRYGESDSGPRRRRNDDKPRPDRSERGESWHPADTADRADSRPAKPKGSGKFKSDKFKKNKFKSDKPRGDRARNDRFEGEAPKEGKFQDKFRGESSRDDRPRRQNFKKDQPKGFDKKRSAKGERSRGDRPREDRPREGRWGGAGDFDRSSRGERARKDGFYEERPRPDRPRSDRPNRDKARRGNGPSDDRFANDGKPRGKGKPFRGNSRPGGGRNERPAHKKAAKDSTQRPADGGKLRLKRPKKAKRA